MQPALARRLWQGVLLVLVLALALAAWWRGRPPPDAADGPIVIGLLQAVSGPLARSEAPQLAAARLAVDEINAGGGLLGRRVVLKLEDTRGDLRVAAAAAERLITSERAVALFGCGSGPCREAVRPVVEAHRHLFFHPAAHEGMESSPHVVYTGPTPNQQALPAVHWALERFGRRFYLVGGEGSYSRRLGAVLRDFIMLRQGQVLGERFVAEGSADVGGLMADLMKLKPDLLVSSLCGEANRVLFDALVADGRTELPVLSLCAAEPEMQAYGGSRLDRHFAPWGYLQSLEDPANAAFLDRLRRSQGAQALASDAGVSTYVALQLWAAAVREVGSPRTDAVNANIVHQTATAPHAFAAVDPQSRHLWRPLRIAQVRPDGQLAQVQLLGGYIRPEPWPSFRSTQHWAAVMSRLEPRP